MLYTPTFTLANSIRMSVSNACAKAGTSASKQLLRFLHFILLDHAMCYDWDIEPNCITIAQYACHLYEQISCLSHCKQYVFCDI